VRTYDLTLRKDQENSFRVRRYPSSVGGSLTASVLYPLDVRRRSSSRGAELGMLKNPSLERCARSLQKMRIMKRRFVRWSQAWRSNLAMVGDDFHPQTGRFR